MLDLHPATARERVEKAAGRPMRLAAEVAQVAAATEPKPAVPCDLQRRTAATHDHEDE